MSINYTSIVPWGRSYQEYVAMFHLTSNDLDKKILGCGDGPASFNCTMRNKGKHALSIDPLYQCTKKQIEARIRETYDDVIGQTEKNKEKFNWTKITSVEELGKIRMQAMTEFLNDYDIGKAEGRYIYAELPTLPFIDDEFDISLSSHFLFLYTDNLSFDFHYQSIQEMCRVAKEVRIFPLLDVNANESHYLPEIIHRLQDDGLLVEKITVNYEFQKGGNKMLKILRNE